MHVTGVIVQFVMSYFVAIFSGHGHSHSSHSHNSHSHSHDHSHGQCLQLCMNIVMFSLVSTITLALNWH